MLSSTQRRRAAENGGCLVGKRNPAPSEKENISAPLRLCVTIKTSGFVRQHSFRCAFSPSESWVILSPVEQSIKAKIEAVGIPLKEWDVQIYRGILTGCNEAFIIDEARRAEILSWCATADERTRTDELIRPILRGRDVKRYGYDWAGLYILALFPARNYAIDDFPAIKRHLLSFAREMLIGGGRPDLAEDPCLSQFCRAKLEQNGKTIIIGGKPVSLRSSSGKTETQKARKKTSNKWFETQDAIAYWDDFSKPKLIWAELVRTGNAFVPDNGGFMVGNTGYVLTTEDNPARTLPHLLGVLNSKIMLYYLDQISTKMDATGWRWLRQHVELLPIAPIPCSRELEALVGETNAGNQAQNKAELDRLVADLYGLSDSELAYIRTKTGDF